MVSAVQPSPADHLDRAVQRLITQVGHWQPGRWAAGPRAGAPTAGWSAGGSGAPGGRGDRVHALVQRLAELAADAEGQPRRPVPRLGDLVLPDQLRVLADDLLAAGAPTHVLLAAAADIDNTRGTL